MLAGYRTKILDGNHLAATEHRIEELRSIAAGPSPGHALVVLRRIGCWRQTFFPCEDGHCPGAKSAAASLDVRGSAGACGSLTRNFSTTGFLFGIANQDAAFVIRQHKQNLTCELLGEHHKIGRCPRGMIYEQQMQITDEAGKSRTIRRVTIELKE